MFAKFKRVVLGNDLAGIGLTLVLLLLALLFFTDGFYSPFNLDAISKDIAIYTIVGLSQVLTLAVGQFNLAIGSMAGATAMIAGVMMDSEWLNLGWPVAILAALVAGCILGWFQGFLIVKTKINPFIISLAMINIVNGANMTVTKNVFFRGIPTFFKEIGKKNYFGAFPLLMIITFVIMIIFWVMFNRTTIGRKILFSGASGRAADFAGIKSGRCVILAHTLSGLLAAIAGVLTVSKLGVAQTSIGSAWMLMSFAAPILGGTLMNGGKVSIVGTLLGAALMTVITNALVLFGVNTYWFQVFTGSVLLLAFVVNIARSRMTSRPPAVEKATEEKTEVGGESNDSKAE